MLLQISSENFNYLQLLVFYLHQKTKSILSKSGLGQSSPFFLLFPMFRN